MKLLALPFGLALVACLEAAAVNDFEQKHLYLEMDSAEVDSNQTRTVAQTL